MSALPRNPGGAAVGRLAELPPLEARVVRCVRLWSGGPQGRAALGTSSPGATGKGRSVSPGRSTTCSGPRSATPGDR